MQVLCWLANELGISRLHRWKRARRVGGFMVRRCARCGERQEQDFPGGKWITVNLKRVRKRKPAARMESSVEQPERAFRDPEPF